jgi:hypothetical protein
MEPPATAILSGPSAPDMAGRRKGNFHVFFWSTWSPRALLNVKGPSPTCARCHSVLWASLTDYSGISPSAASMHSLNAPIRACASRMGDWCSFPVIIKPRPAVVGASRSGITTTGLPNESRVLDQAKALLVANRGAAPAREFENSGCGSLVALCGGAGEECRQH